MTTMAGALERKSPPLAAAGGRAGGEALLLPGPVQGNDLRLRPSAAPDPGTARQSAFPESLNATHLSQLRPAPAQAALEPCPQRKMPWFD